MIGFFVGLEERKRNDILRSPEQHRFNQLIRDRADMMGYYFVLALFILLVHGKTLTFVSSTLSVFNDGYGDFTPTHKIVSWIVFVAVLNN